MAASNLIEIKCPKCKRSFLYDFNKNRSSFEFEEPNSYIRPMGNEVYLRAYIECPKCKSLLLLHVTCYPEDDVVDNFVEEIETLPRKKSKVNHLGKDEPHTEPLF